MSCTYSLSQHNTWSSISAKVSRSQARMLRTIQFLCSLVCSRKHFMSVHINYKVCSNGYCKIPLWLISYCYILHACPWIKCSAKCYFTLCRSKEYVQISTHHVHLNEQQKTRHMFVPYWYKTDVIDWSMLVVFQSVKGREGSQFTRRNVEKCSSQMWVSKDLNYIQL